jgi:cell wall-associated NlpC family hydrolase
MHLRWRERSWQYSLSRVRTYKRWGQRIPKSWFKYQISNSNFKAYQTLNKAAITIRHTDIKLYPHKRGIYFNPKRTGEGFPFDYNQNSSLNINTPLFVSHYSKDKKWVYAKSSYAFGWLPIQDIAFVSYTFKKRFENKNYAITIKDNLKLKRANFKSIVKMGTIFPIDSSGKYLIAKRDHRGYAKLEKVRAIKRFIIAKKPISFTPSNVAFISKQLINEPYGWGGKLEGRDCSSLTRDFFAPFGIYLRRNSSEQSKDSWNVRSLRKFSPYSKKKRILKYAKPFRSLLYVKGHIVLYIGQKNGEPVIMHNYWGIRKNNRTKHITGRSIISTTSPGKEMKSIRKRSLLINTLSKVITF